VRVALVRATRPGCIATAAYHLGVPAWAVVKGVTDHADPRKDDRCVTAAADAAAAVLWRLLLSRLG
jgi:hypothetical protein